MDTGQSSGGLLARLSEELAGAVERAGRSVVTVHGRRRLPASGIVWPGGVVVTADHVLEREEDLALSGADGKPIAAALVGRDPGSDLAVLRPADGSLPAAELATPGSVKVGHLVLALGRPGPGGVMASFGVVSAIGESWRTARGGTVEGYLRADLSLYPGFSGGPLVTAAGLVAGLNSSHLARGQEVAIPAHAVDAVVRALLAGRKVKRAYLGIGSQPVQLPAPLREKLGLEQEVGLMVVWVEPGSPAERDGLCMGDIVVALGTQAVTRVEELQAALSPAVVGQPLKATIVRGGERKEVTVTPGERA